MAISLDPADQPPISYVPVIAHYIDHLPRKSWTFAPGVTLMARTRQLTSILDSKSGQKLLRGTYFVRCDHRWYLPAATKRLTRVFQLKDGDHTDFYPRHVAKNVLLALLIAAPSSRFRIAGHITGDEEDGHFRAKYVSGGREEDVHCLGDRESDESNVRSAAMRYFKSLEPYFLSAQNGQTRRTLRDRIAVGAQGIWTAASIPNPDAALISYTMVLEALLSTAETELAAQVSQRVALLLASTPDDRIAKYRSVKKLYNMRSKLVHGAGIASKKFKANVHPTLTYVDNEALREMGGLAIGVIRSVLNDPKLYGACQSKKSEDLEEFFLTQLFQ